MNETEEMTGKRLAYERERMYAEQAKAAVDQINANGAALGTEYGMLENASPNLRERVVSQLRHSANAARKQGRMSELLLLLDKNPEVARILDLVKELDY